ncbi:MAG: recombinase family protein, partial [Lachnospiraceae bacterium]|nr:recombinase family protein [Lachnospiraceae bacterium]
IERVDIYEQEQPDGRILKHIRFRFPVYFNGKEIEELSWDDETTVETVVLLSKGEIDSKKVRVEFSLEDMDTSGFQQGATYQQIKDRVLEQAGLKVSSLYIAQVKQKCGIIERENYNKAKSENAKQPPCPLEKEKAIMEALRFFGMI